MLCAWLALKTPTYVYCVCDMLHGRLEALGVLWGDSYVGARGVLDALCR
jgi:hypothetical protein